MNKFLAGIIIGVLLCFAGFKFFAKPESTTRTINLNGLSKCDEDIEICRPNPGRHRGISGSARLTADSHLVVHDLHNGSAEADLQRLGIVTDRGETAYRYTQIYVDKSKWHSNGKVANDLESACKLSHRDNEFLLAESGRTDQRIGKSIEYRPWLGRIFHIELDTSSDQASAEVLVTPKLKLAVVSNPVFDSPDSPIEFPHSTENYEGLSCIQLNPGLDEAAKYLVVLGERGGNGTLKSTLYWGQYDTGVKHADREIKWNIAQSLKNIVAPGQGNYPDSHWRDITGLHIDDKQRLFATAAYDTDDEIPPYASVVYQLGVICIDANDPHGETGLCNYSLSPRPVKLSSFKISASSNYHKFESVAAASGDPVKPNHLSIGAEDEDNSGSWWPSIKN